MNQIQFLAHKNAVLKDPTTHALTKVVIEAGCQKDAVDAYHDVKLALDVLQARMEAMKQ